MSSAQILHLAVMALCIVGLGASIYMWNKSVRAKAGELDEPSVVESPRATLFGGVQNSVFGFFFYLALFVASFFFAQRAVLIVSLAAACLAAGVSAYLAYSLLFVTRRSCPICWTGHTVNWALLIVLVYRLTAF